MYTLFLPCRATRNITFMPFNQAQVNNLSVKLLLIEDHVDEGRNWALTETASISVEQTLSTRLHTLAAVQKEGAGARSALGRWGAGAGRTRAVTHWVTWQNAGIGQKVIWWLNGEEMHFYTCLIQHTITKVSVSEHIEVLSYIWMETYHSLMEKYESPDVIRNLTYYFSRFPTQDDLKNVIYLWMVHWEKKPIHVEGLYKNNKYKHTNKFRYEGIKILVWMPSKVFITCLCYLHWQRPCLSL